MFVIGGVAAISYCCDALLSVANNSTKPHSCVGTYTISIRNLVPRVSHSFAIRSTASIVGCWETTASFRQKENGCIFWKQPFVYCYRKELFNNKFAFHKAVVAGETTNERISSCSRSCELNRIAFATTNQFGVSDDAS